MKICSKNETHSQLKTKAYRQWYSRMLYHIIAILGWNFMGADFVEPKYFVDCELLSIPQFYFCSDINESGKVNSILWQHCCDKAQNLYRKSPQDALGHTIQIYPVGLNANTNASNIFFQCVKLHIFFERKRAFKNNIYVMQIYVERNGSLITSLLFRILNLCINWVSHNFCRFSIQTELGCIGICLTLDSMAFLFPFTTVVYVLRFIYSPVFKRLQASSFFLFHRMKTNAQNTTEVFLSVMSVKCDFSSSTSMTNNDWISPKRIIIRSVFIRFQCNTEYLLYMCACICIYIILTVVAWLYFSACLGYSKARRIMYVLLFAWFTHTYIQIHTSGAPKIILDYK